MPTSPRHRSHESITEQRATSYRRVSTLSTTFAASSRTPAGRTGCWLTRRLRPAAMSHDLQDGWEDGHENDPHDRQREAAPDEGKVSKQVPPSEQQHLPQDGAADALAQE